MSINSGQLLQLLATRHSKDVFIPECKNGPTQTARHLRLDAWVMAKSWTNPTTWGYEIKVARNDFIRDDKWHNYLEYCSDFYFVCPQGLIQPEELPAEAGLLWASKNCTKLYVKKKAPRRKVIIPESLFRYVVMCRSKIDAEYTYGERGLEYWRNFVTDKNEKKQLGYLVSKKIREYVEKVERENYRLESRNNELSEIKKRIEELGLNPEQSFILHQAKRKLNEMLGALPDGFEYQLSQLQSNLKRLQDMIENEKRQNEVAA